MEDPESNKKYTAILEAARRLFWKHGLRRVTVEEICKEADTSKMTFYRFFPNKNELAKVVLDRYLQEGLAAFRKIIHENSSAAEKMQQMIQLKMEGTYDISTEFIQDFFIKTDIGLSGYVTARMNDYFKEVIEEFKAGQEKGWIRKDLNVEFLFHFSRRMIPVIYEKEFLQLFRSPQEMIAELTNLIVYGISPIQ